MSSYNTPNWFSAPSSHLSEEIKGARQGGRASQKDCPSAAPDSRDSSLCVARIRRLLTCAQSVALISNDDLPAFGRQAVLHSYTNFV